MSMLKSGSTIAVVSPSWGGVGVFPHRFNQASLWFKKSYDINLVLMPNASNNVSHVSDFAQNRAADIHEAFASRNYDAVWAATGGDHSIAILPFLDFSLINDNPKPFIGYSDNTILCNALRHYSNIQTIYGPSIIGELADLPEPHEFTRKSFEDTFLSDSTSIVASDPHRSTYTEGNWNDPNDLRQNLTPSLPWKIINGTNFEGDIFGGCVESIRQFFGTNYQKCLSGSVFFLESATHHENFGDIDRDFTHIRNAGLFENIVGVILGKWRGLDQSKQTQANELVAKIIGNPDLSILCNVDFGHTDPQMFLPLGWNIECKTDSLTLTRSSVEPS